MPRSIWSGSISFGLVNIPIKLTTAVDSKDVSFRQVRRSDGSRIRYRKVAEVDEEEVSNDEIVKGYEVAPDRYIMIEPDELKGLDPKKSKTIDICDFVDLADIDPIYYDSSYYLVPQDTAAKPYLLLHRALEESGKAAIARFVLRTKEKLVVIRPLGDALAVSTLTYDDEIIKPGLLDLPDDDLEVSEAEIKMAEQLVESMTSDWEPERYHDEHREKVLALIEAKAEGQEVAVPPEVEEGGEVVDLMAALEQSLQAAKDTRAADAEDGKPTKESA